eukprot:SM000070S21291  [mRNA]  locus=s70:165767:166469:+ [translate_table: standard]
MQARPMFKDRRKFPTMADPLLQGHFPMRGLYQALAVAAMCLQEQAATRPLISDVVTALTYLAAQKYDPTAQPAQNTRQGSSAPSPRGASRGQSPRAVASSTSSFSSDAAARDRSRAGRQSNGKYTKNGPTAVADGRSSPESSEEWDSRVARQAYAGNLREHGEVVDRGSGGDWHERRSDGG